MNIGKILIEGIITLLSPVIIGSGNSEETDLDILKDPNEIPYIPATSFLGVIIHDLKENHVFADEKNKMINFLGYALKKESKKSDLYCSDLILVEGSPKNIKVRDGVKINNKTGLADDKSKHDFQILEKGAKFHLKMEADYQCASSKEFAIKAINTILASLKSENGEIRVGAKTNKGFGKLSLSVESIFDYDFSKKESVINWLLKRKPSTDDKLTQNKLSRINNEFMIDAYFNLKTSMIIKSYCPDPEMPDSVHIRSGNDNVLPGTSLKGAIRSRALKILNTLSDSDLSKENADKLFKGLFGFVDEKSGKKKKNDEKKSEKARIMVEEHLLPKLAPELQARIKVDRFTGGVVNGALFDSMPLFSKASKANGPDDNSIRMTLKVKNFKNHEAGLMMLILKDLWTGDLAIGGEKSVGRGVMSGITAKISFGEKSISIKSDFAKLESSEKDTLQSFVNSLTTEINKNGKGE